MSVAATPTIALEAVDQRIRALSLPEVDAVVAIERGGSAPAEMAALILDRPLGRIRLSYRDDLNNPAFSEPQVVARSEIPCAEGGHILLVDDVSVTGATMERARRELAGFTITTLVLKGEAEYVAFPELTGCVTWPWSPGTGIVGPLPATE